MLPEDGIPDGDDSDDGGDAFYDLDLEEDVQFETKRERAIIVKKSVSMLTISSLMSMARLPLQMSMARLPLQASDAVAETTATWELLSAVLVLAA